MNRNAGSITRATRALRVQGNTARTTSRSLGVLGRAWRVAMGPIGWAVEVINILYDAFEPVKKLVDWIIDMVATIPVIGPILKTVANALGYGGDEMPDYDAAAPVNSDRETSVKRVPDRKESGRGALITPAVDTRTVAQEVAYAPNMAMMNMGKTEPITVKEKTLWEQVWYSDDEPKAPVTPTTGATTTTPPVQTAAKPESTEDFSLLSPSTWFKSAPTVTAPATKAVAEPTQTVAAKNRKGAPSSDALPPSVSPQQRGAGTPQAPAMPGVSVDINFTLNGIPDGEFGGMVMSAIKQRQSEFQTLISNIVGEQRRLAYGAK